MTQTTAWPGDRGGHLWPKDREATTRDGVRVRYAVRGPRDAPAVVLCAGFCCPDNFWWYLAPELVERHQVVMLNYRGVGASTTPRRPGVLGLNLRTSDYTMARLAQDVAAVCDAEDLEQAAFVGHSMGCQVALEVYRELGPDRVAALVFVTGPYRSPFFTFYGSAAWTTAFPALYLYGLVAPEPLLRLVPKLAHLPGVLDVAELVRAIGPDTPREPMQVYVEHFARLDAGVVLRVAQGMHGHSAEDLLEEVDVPALVVAGGRDTFTPPSVGREFADRMPEAELLELPFGTHCALLEFPRRINDRVLEFLDRRLPAATADAGSA